MPGFQNRRETVSCSLMNLLSGVNEPKRRPRSAECVLVAVFSGIQRLGYEADRLSLN
jgi:hypothetical protein